MNVIDWHEVTSWLQGSKEVKQSWSLYSKKWSNNLLSFAWLHIDTWNVVMKWLAEITVSSIWSQTYYEK